MLVCFVAVGEDVHQCVDDHGLGDRLDEKAVELQSLGFVADFLAPERRDEHNCRPMAQGLVAFDVAAGLQTIHARHAPIHEDHVVRLSGIVVLNRGDGLLAGRNGIDPADDGAQRLLQNLARRRIVVHDEHAELGEFLWNDRPRPLRGADAEPDGEVESRADAWLAFKPDATAHQLHQPATDGEAQARSAVLACRRHVGLCKRLEQLRRLLGRHADPGVTHRTLELHFLARAFELFDLDPYFAVVR